ncbi:MAG TPA: arsenic resistance N-acetyltransferase ArsN2 [Pseudoduganella sp.]
MKREMTFRPAAAGDWPAIEALLQAAMLPLEGAKDHLDNFVLGVADGRLYCMGGFEQYGAAALLRSVAVDASLRGTGVGQTLLETVRQQARKQGVRELYLLTTTAADFFAKRGFGVISRADTPPDLQASREFQGVCPASATAMVAKL